MKYYLVSCHRGHCGIGRSTDIQFAISANNILEACDRAKKMPSVKHTRMVISAKEITFEEFQIKKKVNAYDRFKRGMR